VILPEGLDIKQKLNLQDAERLTRQEYDPTFYLAGIERVQASIPTIQEAIETLRQFRQAWGFELEDSYRIVLTRYGTGGSYDIKTREVIMRTTQHGKFERSNPAATPIHEITHLCVEHLVEKYRLSFAEKEKLVEGIDVTLFPMIFDPDNKVPEIERQSRLAMLSTLPAFIEQMHMEK
jgi:DNA polymerase III alpha subunit